MGKIWILLQNGIHTDHMKSWIKTTGYLSKIQHVDDYDALLLLEKHGGTRVAADSSRAEAIHHMEFS